MTNKTGCTENTSKVAQPVDVDAVFVCCSWAYSHLPACPDEAVLRRKFDTLEDLMRAAVLTPYILIISMLLKENYQLLLTMAGR